jgi:hypothetical protein
LRTVDALDGVNVIKSKGIRIQTETNIAFTS